MNGSDVLSGRVTFRLRGAWDALLTVASTDAEIVSGAVELDLGGQIHLGTSTVAGADAGGLVTCRVVGGRGGLDEAVTAQDYRRSPTVRQVVTDALGVGGEALSLDSDTTTLDRMLTRWTRTAGTVGEAVTAVARELGMAWRIDAAGLVWIGPETWPVVTVEHVVESEAPSERLICVALESVAIKPGSSWDGRQVSQVDYTIDDVRLRAEVRYDGGRDEIAELLSTLVRRETAGRDLEATYSARLLGQNGDGTLEVRPYDARIPAMSSVPIRFGVPGVSVWQLASGIDVLVAFEGGSPQKPVVVGFPDGSALRLTIDSPDLRLGGDQAQEFVALAMRTQSALDTIAQWCAAHVHTSATPGSPTSAPTVPLVVSTDVAATRVRAL